MPNVTLSAYQEAEVAAAREVARRGFVFHAAITAVVWIVLIAVNLLVASEFPWSVFPVAGMSIGLFAHWYFGVKHVAASVRQHQATIEQRAA